MNTLCFEAIEGMGQEEEARARHAAPPEALVGEGRGLVHGGSRSLKDGRKGASGPGEGGGEAYGVRVGPGAVAP